MPLWDFHTTPNLLSPPEKQDLATSITNLYVSFGLPAFYVNVRFTSHDRESNFNGGQTQGNFAVIRIEHLARQFRDEEQKNGFFQAAAAILTPVLKPKEAIWEYAVTQLERDLWRINGFVPPLPRTEAEKKWVEVNWPVEFETKL